MDSKKVTHSVKKKYPNTARKIKSWFDFDLAIMFHFVNDFSVTVKSKPELNQLSF